MDHLLNSGNLYRRHGSARRFTYEQYGLESEDGAPPLHQMPNPYGNAKPSTPRNAPAGGAVAPAAPPDKGQVHASLAIVQRRLQCSPVCWLLLYKLADNGSQPLQVSQPTEPLPPAVTPKPSRVGSLCQSACCFVWLLWMSVIAVGVHVPRAPDFGRLKHLIQAPTELTA